MKLQQKLKIKNSLGLHVRPANDIVKLLQKYKAQVAFTYRQQTINARSVMSLLMLAAPKNAQIHVLIEGDDAQQVLDELAHAFESRFGEEEAYGNKA